MPEVHPGFEDNPAERAASTGGMEGKSGFRPIATERGPAISPDEGAREFGVNERMEPLAAPPPGGFELILRQMTRPRQSSVLR